MTDYTQLANEAKVQSALCPAWNERIVTNLADALLACQRERDELAAERNEARDMQHQHRRANEGLVGRIAELEAWKAELFALVQQRSARIAELEAEVERLRALLPCAECGPLLDRHAASCSKWGAGE